MIAINLDDDEATVLHRINTASFRYLPLYQGQLNHIVGLIDVGRFFQQKGERPFSMESLLKQSEPAYFIPKGTSIMTQATQFRDMARHTGFVVDEYGEIQGLVTLDDVIEEIVGEFSDSLQDTMKMIRHQEDGSVVVDAGLSLRIINRELGCQLHHGAKTLSGFIVEELDGLPLSPMLNGTRSSDGSPKSLKSLHQGCTPLIARLRCQVLGFVLELLVMLLAGFILSMLPLGLAQFAGQKIECIIQKLYCVQWF